MSAREPRPESGMRSKRIIVTVAVALATVVVIGVVVPLVATSNAKFFSRYHTLERRYVNLGSSAHEGVGCRQCHETRPVANGLALIADFYTSFVTTDTMPSYFTFKPPTREACLKCHEDEWSTNTSRTDRIPHPAHLRVASETRNCVDCHKWTAHLETYLDKHKEMPFSGVCVAYGCHVGTKTTDQCFNCHHILHEDGAKWRTEHPRIIKETGENACLESCHTVEQCQTCHTTGVRPKFTGMTIEIGMKAIERLHVKPEWTSRYHGAEALKAPKNCLRCHQSEGECDECHRYRPAFHGSTTTWIGRHSKQTKDVHDPRCIACHKQAFCDDCHRQFKEME